MTHCEGINDPLLGLSPSLLGPPSPLRAELTAGRCAEPKEDNLDMGCLLCGSGRMINLPSGSLFGGTF